MGTIKDKIKKQDKEERAYKKMLDFGWTPEQASGIVGNLVWESNLDTTVLGTADDKGSKGIAQWHSGRLKTLQNRYGSNWTDLDNQLEFVNWELNNTHKKAGDKLRKSKGVYNTGRVVSDDYEIPKDKWVVNEKRQNVVYDIHRKYSGSPLTDQDRADMLKGTASRAISNYNATQQVTTDNTNFETPQISTNLASVPDAPEKDEVAQAKQELQQKQNEENFINDLYAQRQEEEQVVQQQPKAKVPQANVLERYAQIENFVDEPITAQQGGDLKIMMQSILEPKNKNISTFNMFPKAVIAKGFDKPYFPPRPTLSIEDNRKINATTGKTINPNVDLTSGKYDKDTIKKIIISANKYGVDPYTALSIGLQETGLGSTDSNVGHIIGKQDVKFDKNSNAIDDFVRVVKSKQDYANKLGIKNEDTIIQAYNGLGKIYPETEQNYHGYKMKKIYGVDVPKEGIDMRKNPLYGKRIIDLRDNVLKQNKELVNYVSELTPKVNYFTEGKEQTEYLPQFQQGGNIEVKDSKIQGKGAFTNSNFKKGDIIGLAHTNEQPSTDLGQYHNHSDNPNSENVKVGNERYLYALKSMKKGEEITVDYRKQPELEQPEDFAITEKEKAFLKLMQQYKK